MRCLGWLRWPLVCWPGSLLAQDALADLPFREAGSVGAAQVLAALLFLALLAVAAVALLRMRRWRLDGFSMRSDAAVAVSTVASRRLGPRLQLTILEIDGARWLVFDNGQSLVVKRQLAEPGVEHV